MGNNEKMVTSSNAATNGNMVQNDHVEKSKATMPAVNRTFKSTVFIMLFEDKKNLLELYNAISGKHYTDPELLEINTLENAIYMSIKNDVSFLIDGRLSLYEHQLTYNSDYAASIFTLYCESIRKYYKRCQFVRNKARGDSDAGVYYFL